MATTTQDLMQITDVPKLFDAVRETDSRRLCDMLTSWSGRTDMSEDELIVRATIVAILSRRIPEAGAAFDWANSHDVDDATLIEAVRVAALDALDALDAQALAVDEVDTASGRRIWQVSPKWNFNPGTWGWECLRCGDWEGAWPSRARAEQRHANHHHLT